MSREPDFAMLGCGLIALGLAAAVMGLLGVPVVPAISVIIVIVGVVLAVGL